MARGWHKEGDREVGPGTRADPDPHCKPEYRPEGIREKSRRDPKTLASPGLALLVGPSSTLGVKVCREGCPPGEDNNLTARYYVWWRLKYVLLPPRKRSEFNVGEPDPQSS